jgi:cell division cycle 14
MVQERLYYVALTGSPANNIASKHFFSIDAELVYWNFYLDFGPLNLGQLYRYDELINIADILSIVLIAFSRRFCQKLNDKLSDPKLKEKAIYFYSGTHGHRRANATYLICSWSQLFLGRTPEEALKPFRGSAPLPPWHDATPTSCTFNLTVLDTLRGLQKARECGFFDFQSFDIAEYEHYEQVENGDLNWIVPGKFVAFAGPQGSRDSVEGYKMLTPDDYIAYFKKKRVSLVVRLNKKYYEAKRFTAHGIDHVELYFLDGSNPPDHILAKFLQVVEETPGAVAVHCKAGLGRTGCCIGSYLMKHYRFTAEEVMGWLRIVRPGSIIGPQQNWIKEMQVKITY